MRPDQIKRILDKHIPHPKVPLNYTNQFTLLIAVLLSARSTDVMVNKITPLLFAKATTARQMAQLSVAGIQKIIKPIGLSPQKARAIKRLSEILVEEHGGRVPKTFKELEALPGVGHKTASVVMAQAFGVPTFPVDTHIFRCARRWGLSSGKSVISVENDLKNVFHEKDWNRLHLQIILFGRKYCTAQRHNKEECPVCSKL